MKNNSNTYVTIRAPKDLRDDINAYAQRHNTTLTRLTLDYYRALLAAEGRQEAEQV